MLGIDDNSSEVIEGTYADDLYDMYVARFGFKPRKTKISNGKQS